MNRIKLLPEIVANQIAAGEVVNAPSNVVKEMMENSIDAGAKCVKVNFRNGGKELIQIIDDKDEEAMHAYLTKIRKNIE